MSEVVNIPQLRFPEFNGGWKESRIGKIYKDLRTGSTPSRAVKSYFKGDNPWITSGELKYNRISTTFEQISDEAIKDTNLVLYQPGTLFIAITGLEAPGTRGKCAINAVPSTTNQSCLAFRKVDSVDTIYMFYWYLKYGKPLYFKYAQGTKQQSFNNKIVEKFQIFLPNKPEQQKIAAFLSAVDNKIEQLSKKQELLGEYKKGLMQQIFSQVIRFKADDGCDFPDWGEKKLSDLSLSHYQGINTTADKVEYHKEGFPIAQAKHITSEFMDFNNIKYVNEATYESYKKKFKPNQNDILISNIGTLGKIVLVENDIDFLVAWNIFKVELDINKVIPKFLLFSLKLVASRGYFDRMKTGNATKFVNKADMLNIQINFPSKLEQKKIANFLSSIDSKIEQVGKQLDESKQFKKALLQQMFV